MKNEKQLQKLLSDALSKDLLFASFRYPNKDKKHFVCQTTKSIRSIDEVDKSKEIGFVLQDFLNKNGLWIQGDIVASAFEEPIELPDNPGYNRTFLNDQSAPINKSDYLEDLGDLIESIKSGASDKVVFSRTIQTELNESNLIQTYFNLLKKYKDAFVFLVHLPGGITWIGASPETLISEKQGQLNTMALAGTRNVNDSAWTKKEKDEQTYVASYIEAALKKLKVPFKKSATYEMKLQSGIMHLCNNYCFSIQNKNEVWKLVHMLHPTPAVCGIPAEKAKALILKTEKHHRSFYAGFLGSVNIDDETNLFVNLRSAQVFEDQACLYVGGGITSESNAEAEWEETEMKSRTLLDALEGRDKM